MTGFARLIRRYPMTSFAVLSCLIGWSVYFFAFVGFGSNPDIFPMAPAIAAAIVTGCQGRERLRAWGRRLRSWAAPWWLYAIAVIMPIAIFIAIVAVNHLYGAPLPTGAQLSRWPEIPVTFVVFLIMVGFGEEGGWSAFATPTMVRRHSLITAAAVLAGIRITWHLPEMLSGDMPWIMGLAGIAGFQLVLLVLLQVRGAPWSLAAVFHATLNAFGGAFFFSMVAGADRERLEILLGVAYGLVGLLALTGWMIYCRYWRGDHALTASTSTEQRTGELADHH